MNWFLGVAILQYLNNLFEVINLHLEIFLIIPPYFAFKTLNEDIFNFWNFYDNDDIGYFKKENVAGIECHENPKTRALWEFKVAKWWKGGDIRLKHALNWIKSLEFITTTPKNIQNVNKMGNEKCNTGSLSHFKRRHFDVLEKNKKNITFLLTSSIPRN